MDFKGMNQKNKKSGGVFFDPMEEFYRGFGNFYDETMEIMKETGIPCPNEKYAVPDTFGCDRLFAEQFVNDDMWEDFNAIASDFLFNEYKNLLTYDMVSIKNYDTGDISPEDSFIRFVTSLMVNAVNGGSEYAKALVLNLYKTYYRREYKQLKRFSTISRDEVMSLARAEKGDDMPAFFGANMARILFISKLSGITIKEDCNSIYMALNTYYEKMRDKNRFDYGDDGDYEEYKKNVEIVQQTYNMEKLYTLDMKMSKFVGNSLRWNGYSEDYAELCDETDFGLTERVANTLRILNKSYPSKKDYTEEEIIFYATIFHMIGALTSTSDFCSRNLREIMYGPKAFAGYEEKYCKFNPDDITVREKPKSKTPVMIEIDKPSSNAEAYGEKLEINDYAEEINALRRKIHKLEEDNKELHGKLSETKRLDEENKKLKEDYEALNKETSALRNYVYTLDNTEEDDIDIPVDKLKEDLKDTRVIIIGGHTKWTAKLKKEFPDWIYISPDITGTIDPSIVDKADMVYFFTDLISHTTYNRYMNIVRERNVNFRYIHGVNIEKNIRQIHEDLTQ